MRVLILAPFLLAACAQTPADTARSVQAAEVTQVRLDKALAGLTPETPVTCLPPTQSPQSSYYGDTILYRVSRGLVYRNDTSGGCYNLARNNDIPIVRTPVGRLCQGDIVQVVDRTTGITTGGCTLGEFVPYRRAR